jgi:tRNA A64-2'-O-ribosylphosphate transferase
VRACVAERAYYPIVCVVASATSAAGTLACAEWPGVPPWPFVYLPGAADDDEAWAQGLTPALFWAHAPALLAAGPDDCAATVRAVVSAQRTVPFTPTTTTTATATITAADVLARTVWVGSTGVGVLALPDAPGLTVAPHSPPALLLLVCHARGDDGDMIGLGMHPDKRGRGTLKAVLPSVIARVRAARAAHPSLRIVVACPDGRSTAPAIAVAVLCALGPTTPCTKAIVAQALAAIVAAVPGGAHPPRPLLKAINEVLMPDPR